MPDRHEHQCHQLERDHHPAPDSNAVMERRATLKERNLPRAIGQAGHLAHEVR